MPSDWGGSATNGATTTSFQHCPVLGIRARILKLDNGK